jgi:threonine dehydratase
MVTPDDIRAAQARIRGHVRRTPVLALEGEAVGHDCPIRLKLELFQHTGSFKPRGAFNTLLSAKLPGPEVVAASGGNHGAAVAFAAGRLGLPARIFVPEIASAVKVARIRGYGASVEIGGRQYADALEHTARKSG